ncbi:MAG: hypothetical protein P8163_00830 [Candidatus Thiodiazotropha sp.]
MNCYNLFFTFIRNLSVFIKSFILIIAFPASALLQTEPYQLNTDTLKTSYTGDPIAFVAHGQLFNHDGKIIDPKMDFIRETMDLYINHLTQHSDKKRQQNARRLKQRLVESFSDDDLTQRFLLMEYLLQGAQTEDQVRLSTRGHVLRKHWYLHQYGLDLYQKLIDQRRNFPTDVLAFGENEGILLKATEASGREYIQECRKAGVPIPPRWRGDGWQYEGDLTTNFLGFGNPTEVWRADSNSPAGLCVALPRFQNEDTISALGMICLGTESSNACFFDYGVVDKNQEIEPEELISGADLANGVCTDCHAGENPYVVHPNGPLDMWPDNKPAQWYTPLIKSIWPQNPGPFGALSLVDINPLPPENDKSCIECHNQDLFGRFPDVLLLNAWRANYDGNTSNYCRVVLNSALTSTMPGVGSLYDQHAKAMLAFCKQTPTPPGVVPPPETGDDPDLLGPPVVLAPLYGCAEAVQVTGASYEAKLTVFIDGVDVASETVKSPSHMIIKVPPLVAGQVVTAIQEEDGAVSPDSVPVTVLDHTVHYPSGLPLPIIDPTLIHECGRVIAVRHIRGANISVFTNGANDVTYSTGGDWTNIAPAIKPFKLGDRYSAQQSICKDFSGITGEEVAVSEPSPMPIPEIDPMPPIVGQELIRLDNLPHGALTEVLESSVGVINTFATAVSWNSEVDITTGLGHPLAVGDSLGVISSLCNDNKIEFPEPRPCERLNAPRIAQPFVGDMHITVTDAVPGAHVIIYDSGLNEIGDGSGSPIGLIRPLVVGDVLTVIQKVGDCTSSTAYQISVVCTNNDECG